MPAQSGLQSGEQVYALLAQRGQIAANAAEGNRSCFAAERAGDLSLHLDHAHISLGLVIIKRHGEVGEEGENRFFAHLKPVKQADSRMALACRLGRPSTGEAWIGAPAFLEQAIILSPQSQQGKWVQTPFASLLGFLHALFHHQEQLFQVSGPLLLVDFVNEDQFAQMMDIAEGMAAVFIQEVRTPAIMDRGAFELGQDADRLQSFSSSLGMYRIMCQMGRAAHIQPMTCAFDIEAGLILMQDRGRHQGRLDLLFHLSQVLGAVLDQASKRALAHRGAQQVSQNFTGSPPGQELLLNQIDRHGPNPRPVLERGSDSRWEGRAAEPMAVGALLALCLMFLHDQARCRHIDHLSPLIADRKDRLQIVVAVRARGKWMEHHLIGDLTPLQAVACMTGLSTCFLAAFFAQTLGLTDKAIRGRWKATIATIFPHLLFQGGKTLREAFDEFVTLGQLLFQVTIFLFQLAESFF
jgi:hypothetical protein